MKTIEPNQQNNKIVSDVIAIKIKKSLQERYPTAESVVEDLE